MIPTRCRTYACEVCGPARMREWPWLLAWARPERFLTLTKAPEDRERRRGQVRDYVYRLRQRGYRVQIAWSTEPNPAGTGLHIHALQHGEYIPQRVLQSAWGGRIAHISAVQDVRSAGLYVVKRELAAAGYTMKESLTLDRRPVHYSRGYMRGHRLREVQAAVRLERFGFGPCEHDFKAEGYEWRDGPTGSRGRALEPISTT